MKLTASRQIQNCAPVQTQGQTGRMNLKSCTFTSLFLAMLALSLSSCQECGDHFAHWKAEKQIQYPNITDARAEPVKAIPYPYRGGARSHSRYVKVPVCMIEP
jgi:hypothetical protein